jgi:hypothetical protein
MKLSLIMILVALMMGCAYFPNTVVELKENFDPIEAELPMSLGEIQISLQAYNQRCNPELFMERDLTNPKRAFYSQWGAGNVHEHYEFEELPDGKSTRILYWSTVGSEDYFLERKFYTMTNPEECIYYWM